MNLCPSCGGVINIDCYNPIECASISNSQDHYEISILHDKIEILTKALQANGINIPNLDPQPSCTQTDIDDELPF